MSGLKTRTQSTRIALLLCLLLLILPTLQLSQALVDPASARTMTRGGPLSEEDERGCEVVSKMVKATRPARLIVETLHIVSVAPPRPPASVPQRAAHAAPSERDRVNGCGAFLRC